jgi:hypothetical protein
MSISMIDEDCVERIYKDAEDLFVSMKLQKRKKISLDEVIAEIGAHVVDDSDATEIVREMRDRSYEYSSGAKTHV